MTKTNRIPRQYATRKTGIPGATSARPAKVMYKHCERCGGPYTPETESRTTWIVGMSKKGVSGWECICCGTWTECEKGDNGSFTKKIKRMGYETKAEAQSALQAALTRLGA